MRKMPHNLEAEQSVIGGMLVGKSAIESASEKLQGDSFYQNEHQVLFNAIMDLYHHKTNVDIPTLTTYLVDKDLLYKAGGVEYFASLVDRVFTLANIEYYINIVYDNALSRRLIEVSEKIASSGYTNEYDASDYLELAEKEILAVSRSKNTGDILSASQVIQEYTSILEERANSEGFSGTPTGYKYIDQLTNGFQPGNLVILAARPGAGKTAFALNVAKNAAHLSKKPVVFFSLEMDATELMGRVIAATGRIEGEKLATGKLENEDWLRLSAATTKISADPLFFDQSAPLKVSDIASKCRKIEREHNGLGMIVIDYLQLLSPPASSAGKSPNEIVSEFSRSLKMLARELKVPVLVLSQLSRKVEERANKRPMLSDLRDSGAIEQDADIVIFLYREDYYDENSEKAGLVDVIFAKHRNGSTGDIHLNFEKEYSKFNTVETNFS